MKVKKTYYSISEVSKMLNIHEHTIRFWNTKLPILSTRSEKGKTRFFNSKQIKMISNIHNLLKSHDSLNLALQLVSISSKKQTKSNDFLNHNDLNSDKITKIKNLTNNLRNLINKK